MSAPIFRYNLLNYLSAITHKQTMLMMPSPPHSVSQKFLHLLETVCREDDCNITLGIKMTDLALYIEETRLTVSRMLNALAGQQAISISRSCSIPSLRTLREHIGSHSTVPE